MSFLRLEEVTEANTDYRRVIQTAPGLFQLVLMSLDPGDSIPAEIHDGVQFLRLESGELEAYVDGEKFILLAGDSITIFPGQRHIFVNASSKTAKLYSIYTPPEHPIDRVDVSQPEK